MRFKDNFNGKSPLRRDRDGKYKFKTDRGMKKYMKTHCSGYGCPSPHGKSTRHRKGRSGSLTPTQRSNRRDWIKAGLSAVLVGTILKATQHDK